MRHRAKRKRRVLTGRTVASSMGLAPLVDVVFLLLLFLVLTARFIPQEERFEVRLPEKEPPTVQQYLEPFRVAVREGAAGPADVAIAGDEKTLRAALDRLRDLGVSDFSAAVAAVDAETGGRTLEFLAAYGASSTR